MKWNYIITNSSIGHVVCKLY